MTDTSTPATPTKKALNLSLRPDLHAGLIHAAEERAIGVSKLVERAIEDLLAKLRPVDEVLSGPSDASQPTG